VTPPAAAARVPLAMVSLPSPPGSRSLGLAIYGAVAGSVLFRMLVALALRWGLNPNDLKLVTALFVFAALVLPKMLQRRPKPAALATLP